LVDLVDGGAAQLDRGDVAAVEQREVALADEGLLAQRLTRARDPLVAHRVVVRVRRRDDLVLRGLRVQRSADGCEQQDGRNATGGVKHGMPRKLFAKEMRR